MENKLLLLHCAEGSKKALDKMMQDGKALPKAFSTYQVPCAGRINEVMLMEALQDGYKGVLVIGCYKDNCKYLDGNKRADKKVSRVQDLLKNSEIEDKYIDIAFISPDESKKLSGIIDTFHKKILVDSK